VSCAKWTSPSQIGARRRVGTEQGASGPKSCKWCDVDHAVSLFVIGFRYAQAFPSSALVLLLLLAASACIYGQDVNPPVHAQEGAELKGLEIKQVKLFAWQVVHKNKKYVEVQEFRETQGQHLIPSGKFDVKCEVVGGSDVGDYFLWTTIDFLVAPVTRACEPMDNGALGSSVGWGR
jgi:hypothetical protein